MIQGRGASPGRIRGQPRRRTDATTEDVEVLVATELNPAHTPLIMAADAVVVERGSMTSHAATICREFGNPCVVNAEGAVEKLAGVDSVLVDGDEGTVEW